MQRDGRKTPGDLMNVLGKVTDPSSKENPKDTFWVTVVRLGGGPDHVSFSTIEEACDCASGHLRDIGKGVISVKVGLYP